METAKKNTKYLFVTGGVCSGLGKGITASSIALLLKKRGLTVFNQKCDGYLCTDPGTLSPTEHGEVFVTSDGAETDLDLGHYERFVDVELNRTSSVTMGSVYSTVLARERAGDFLGKTAQVIPHITDEIKSRFRAAAESSGADVVIIEVGGTVGDLESNAFLEAIRQFQLEEDTALVHVVLVPQMYGSNEIKTKPCQQSVSTLRGLGLQPNFIVARTPILLPNKLKDKISMFCSVPPENVISSVDVKNVYEIPLVYHEQNFDDLIIEKLGLEAAKNEVADIQKMVELTEVEEQKITIALVGKYTLPTEDGAEIFPDAYLSCLEALKHAGYAFKTKVEIEFVNAESLEPDDADLDAIFSGVSGIFVPGGFGKRGVLGKIRAANFARTHNVPYLGVCLGLQVAVIEFARNVLGYADADSEEFSPTPHNVISLMEAQKKVKGLGGTMRLGNYPCHLKPDTKAYKAYGQADIVERHRHRYEVNSDFVDELEANGMTVSGVNPELGLVEFVEISAHPFYVCSQAHPEFGSRPNRPSPIYKAFIEASIEQSKLPL